MASDDIIIDQYSGFDHKTGGTGQSLGSPTWVTDIQDLRRLRAYLIAGAYMESVARHMVPDSSPKKKEWREHGDPAAVVARFAAAVLGDALTIRVPGADIQLPDTPPVMSPPVELDGDATPVEKAGFDAHMRVWETQSLTKIEAWEADHEQQPGLIARQDYLRSWADRTRWEAQTREEQAELVVPLGDGVSVYKVDPESSPTRELWDPDSYFPVFIEGNVTEFPDKVHLAYEIERADSSRWVRRVTYELVAFTEFEGATPSTSVPYQDEPVTKTCLLTDAWFNLENAEGDIGDLESPNEFEQVWDGTAWIDLDEHDLGIDFIPIIHKTPKSATRTHFGQGLLTRPAQLWDEIANSDTDSGRASALNGNPPMVASDLAPAPDAKGTISLGPGKVLPGGKDAKLTALDMTNNLKAATDYSELLRDRVSGVMSIPGGLWGRPVDQGAVASGKAWLLSFTAFIQEIRDRRLTLDPKLRLEMKIVQRLAIVANDPKLFGDTTVYDAFVEFGSYMPTDLGELIEQITALAEQGLMEPGLCFRLLEAAGMEIGTVRLVVEQIQFRDTVRALDLQDIVGPEYAAEWLGAPTPEEPESVDDQNPPEPIIDLGS